MELHATLGLSRPPATLLRFPAARRKPDWQRYFYAAIAAALIIAMIGVSFRYLTMDPGPGDDDAASVPPVVLGLASPETNSACNGTRSIPVIIGTTSAPDGIAAIVMTPDGDLILDCEGRQDVLATGVQTVYAMARPGVVFLVNADTSSRYLNVFTGATFDVQLTEPFTSPRSTLGLLTNRNSGRLAVIPATGDSGAAAILDLDTFAETPLVDHRGEPIQVSEISAITANYRGDCIALAYSTHVSMQNTDYLDGFLQVSADGSTSAMAAAESLQPVPRELAISPDCDTVASAAFQGEPMMGTTKVTVQSFADTTALATYSAETPDTVTRITWLKSGNGLVFGAGDALYWEAPFETIEPVSLGDDMMVDSVMLTRDPDVVAISVVDWNAGTDQSLESTLIFNAATRDTMTLESSDVYPSSGLLPRVRNTLIMRTSPVQVFDAATGDHLGDIGNSTTDLQTTIVAEIDPYDSAEIGLVGSSLDDLWRILDASGMPMMAKIDPPVGLEVDGMPTVAMSQDGWVYVAGSAPGTNGWLKNLDDPAADWVEVVLDADSSARVQFLPRGDQQVAPQTTPITTCDLSADFPLVLYANSFPVEATTLILNDEGELLLRCAGGDDSTVIATDVVAVTKTGLPSTIVISTRDENSMEVVNGVPASSQLVNLTTGERLDIGVGSLSMRLQQAQHELWYLATSDDDSLTPIVVNLQTLESHPLPSNGLDTSSLIAMATASDDGSVTAVATLRDKSSLNLRSVDVVDESTPLEILIIGQTWEDQTRFTIDDIGGRASGISMSPNGRYLTIEVLDSIGFNGNNQPTQLVIIDTSTGDIVAQTDVDTDAVITEPVWTSDSSAFLYLSDNHLMALEPAASSSPREVFASELALSNLALTSDPNVVLVMDGVSGNGATYHRVQIDTGMSELLGQQGWEVGLLYFHRQVPIISLSNGSTITWQDSGTGQVLEQSSLTSTPETESETDSVDLYIDSPAYAGAISYSSTIWVWGDDLQVRAIDVPNTPSEIFGSLSETSPDGRYIVVSALPQGYVLNQDPILPKTLYVMDTLAEEPVWIPVQADVSATPVASQATCDLTQDMPLFIGVEESPIASTAIVLTPGGSLILACGDTSEALVDGVTTASTTLYPGVMYLESTRGTGFYSLPLRQMFALSDPSFLQSEVNLTANTSRSTGRWWIVPSSDQSTHASILDLQTFTETHLVDGDGNRLKLSNIGVVGSNYDDDTIIIAFSRYDPTLRTSYLGGYVVIENGEAMARTSNLPAQVMPRELAIAPDGSHFATATHQGADNEGTTTLDIYTPNGTTPIRSHSFSMPNALSSLTWLKSGEGLVFTDGTSVNILRIPYPTSDIETLVERENITGIALTRDPDVITAGSLRYAQIEQTPPITYVINTRNGEVIELEGHDMFMPSFLQPVERNALLLRTAMVVVQDGDTTVRVHDAATGELLGEMNLPVQITNGFSSSQYGYGRGEIGIIAFNAETIWLLLDGNEPVLRQIAAPEGINGASPVSVQISEDGWIYLRASGSPSPGWLMAPGDTTWTEIEFAPDTTSPGVTFVLGVP